MRFYLARLVTLLLSVILLIPTALSLLLCFFRWATWPLKFASLNRAVNLLQALCDSYLYDFTVFFCLRAIERWIMGTRTPRVENVKE
ncbi:MAG: hypothetical protein L0Z48_10645 [candidate division Zixibacteria bacterium]|nr:hypothetical protein [candidate division Zixibacteria bacterium]